MNPGAVAQLGERELCKLEVVGSIPIGSTSRTMRACVAEIIGFEFAWKRFASRAFGFFDIVKAGLAGIPWEM